MITIKTIQQFTCSDGAKFLDKDEAEKHEAEYQLVKPILDRFPKGPNLERGTYRQHNIETLRQLKRDLFKLVLGKVGDDFPKWKGVNPDDVRPDSVVGRVMSDYGGPIASAWCNLGVFNFTLGREYDQPYFANHPEEAKPE